ncbi:FKBP-type peptidyl-prolyl cis-trans isomerase [Enterobacteriaceae endosymbiont of Donacia bicoloricornis]|uniref:FKBP-type peptidyl-prolyl cis-trans isomerase n=1 Tax=Enterobacteriaceae endosymbiont of Donacia bicoloricornis TaxID=2675772 RepID=UPI001448D7C0|nr:FKBP-type peptidyl-prolyl cis-trans isomerase [Enterobacteriaceae endosymbiont of Donacia bicoloricornis]QJC37844.1 FKBP-type peptidyl-prolyl cis-trans isomerase [Enterobacteriaceae endosymbiont of Donacia bicoloricornis]
MKFFNKKISIFIILILSISLNLSTANAFKLNHTSWWNKNKTKTFTKKKIKNQKKKKVIENKKKEKKLKNDNEKMSYTLGFIIGKYLANTYQAQKTLRLVLEKKFILQGVSDSLENKNQLSNDEMERLLSVYEKNVKNFTPDEAEDEAKMSKIQGQKYIKNFLKKKNVKKTKSGLIYQIHKMGHGKKITNNKQIIVIKYTGKLADGTLFDSTEPNKPLFISLKKVITGWKEGLKYIRKGGKITLIIPPKLAYGSEVIAGIPPNSTLIFEIELVDIRNSMFTK